MATNRTGDLLFFCFLLFNHARHAVMRLADQVANRLVTLHPHAFTLLWDQTTG